MLEPSRVNSKSHLLQSYFRQLFTHEHIPPPTRSESLLLAEQDRIKLHSQFPLLIPLHFTEYVPHVHGNDFPNGHFINNAGAMLYWLHPFLSAPPKIQNLSTFYPHWPNCANMQRVSHCLFYSYYTTIHPPEIEDIGIICIVSLLWLNAALVVRRRDERSTASSASFFIHGQLEGCLAIPRTVLWWRVFTAQREPVTVSGMLMSARWVGGWQWSVWKSFRPCKTQQSILRSLFKRVL